MPPPRDQNPLTAVDYLVFNQMMARIRALEHVATEHFLRGNSYYRKTLATIIGRKASNKRLPNPASSFFNGETADDINARAEFDRGHIKLPDSAFDPDGIFYGHGCTFPYCPTPSGTCELCGLNEIHEQLLAAVENL